MTTPNQSIQARFGNNMKLETKKKLARLLLRLAHPLYKGGLKVKHNGKKHYVMRVSKLQIKSIIKSK